MPMPTRPTTTSKAPRKPARRSRKRSSAPQPAPVKRGPGRPRKDGSPAQPRIAVVKNGVRVMRRAPSGARTVRTVPTLAAARQLLAAVRVGPPSTSVEPALRLQIQGLRSQLDAVKAELARADAALEGICDALASWLERDPELPEIVAVTQRAFAERNAIPPKLRAPKKGR